VGEAAKGPRSLGELIRLYRAEWEIWKGAGGGYIALRHVRVDAWEEEKGLSEIVCAVTIEDMVLRLGEQACLKRKLSGEPWANKHLS
jgi:hypothetical protein